MRAAYCRQTSAKCEARQSADKTLATKQCVYGRAKTLPCKSEQTRETDWMLDWRATAKRVAHPLIRRDALT